MASQTISIHNLSHPLGNPLSVKLCNTFLLRFKGLMFAAPLSTRNGILIDELIDSKINAAIHMFFMNYDIGVVWINSKNIVVDAHLARRWHPYYAPNLPARYIMEIHPDRLAEFSPGDQISFKNE